MKDLPEIAHLRGLGNPMFFTFSTEPKSNILICHAAIMGTFIVSPNYKISLCQENDDPRLPHFVDYLVRNKITTLGNAIDELEKMVAQRKETMRGIDKSTEQIKANESKG